MSEYSHISLLVRSGSHMAHLPFFFFHNNIGQQSRYELLSVQSPLHKKWNLPLRNLQIWSPLLKKSLMENYISCAFLVHMDWLTNCLKQFPLRVTWYLFMYLWSALHTCVSQSPLLIILMKVFWSFLLLILKSS